MEGLDAAPALLRIDRLPRVLACSNAVQGERMNCSCIRGVCSTKPPMAREPEGLSGERLGLNCLPARRALQELLAHDVPVSGPPEDGQPGLTVAPACLTCDSDPGQCAAVNR